MTDRYILDNFSTVILAAGRGTRLNCFDLPKVMLEVNGRPIVEYIVDTLNRVGFSQEQIRLVVGYKGDVVKKYFGNRVTYADQQEQLGTAHAAYVGMNMIVGDVENVLVLNGDDSVFYQPETLFSFMKQHIDNHATISVLTTIIESGNRSYGRVIHRGGRVLFIEKENLSDDDLQTTQMNTNTLCINKKWFLENFKHMKKIERLNEYGLPTAPELAQDQGMRIQIIPLKNSSEWFGVNTKEELEEIKKRFNN